MSTTRPYISAIPSTWLWLAAGLVAATGCRQAAKPTSPDEKPQTAGETAMSITMQSPAFAAGETIPRKHTGEGEDLSPALSWSGIPTKAQELALICDDPDAPRPEPWVHWVIYNMPATLSGLPEGVATVAKPVEPAAVLQGKNSWGKLGYGGPMPPPGHGVHHYHFKLYALDATLKLPAGLTKEELLKQIKPHVIAEGELIGTYQR